MSSLLTNSFAYVRLPYGLACLSNLAESAQITGTDIKMARYLSALSPQNVRSRFCSSRVGLNEHVAHEIHVTQATIKAHVTGIFVSFTSKAVLGPPWHTCVLFRTDALTPTNEAPFTKASFCYCSGASGMNIRDERNHRDTRTSGADHTGRCCPTNLFGSATEFLD